MVAGVRVVPVAAVSGAGLTGVLLDSCRCSEPT